MVSKLEGSKAAVRVEWTGLKTVGAGEVNALGGPKVWRSPQYPQLDWNIETQNWGQYQIHFCGLQIGQVPSSPVGELRKSIAPARGGRQRTRRGAKVERRFGFTAVGIGGLWMAMGYESWLIRLLRSFTTSFQQDFYDSYDPPFIPVQTTSVVLDFANVQQCFRRFCWFSGNPRKMGEGDGMQVGQFRSFLSRQDGAVVPCCHFLHGWWFFGGFSRSSCILHLFPLIPRF